MAIGLRQEGSEFDETADFIEKMDKFFDCLNVSSMSEGIECTIYMYMCMYTCR